MWLTRKRRKLVLNAKQFVATALFMFVLLMIVFAPLSGQESAYDPWLDYNDDGIIDVNDLAAMGDVYGSTGEPLSFPMALTYDSGWVNVTDKQGQYFNITHNLNITTNFMVRMWGRTTPDGGIHRKHLYGTGYTPGWNSTHGGTNSDHAYSAIQTIDGGYALAGWTYLSPGGIPDHTDARFVKFDFAGNLEWNQTWGGEKWDALYSVIQTDDGGYALAGYTASYGPVIGDSDFWLIKTNSSGSMVWNKTYHQESYFATERAWDVVQTSDGGYALAGYKSGQYGTGYDFWLVKTNSTGDQMWVANRGGNEDDMAYSLVQTNDGGYLLAGQTFSYGSGVPSESNAWLIKFASNGVYEWDKPFGGNGDDKAYSLIQTADGNYSFAGHWESTITTAYDFWLVKIYPNGTKIWGGTYDFGYYPNWVKWDFAHSVVQTSDGGYVLAGETDTHDANWDLLLAKIDPNGNLMWSRTFGGAEWDEAWSVVQTSDGGYALAGYTASFGAGNMDFYLVKTDPFGLIEAFEFGLATAGHTADTLTLYRGAIDPYWNYVRVRIWVAKDTP